MAVDAYRLPAAPRLPLPGALYSAVSIALIVTIGALTLTSRQPPPPTIAELQPEGKDPLRQQIDSSSVPTRTNQQAPATEELGAESFRGSDPQALGGEGAVSGQGPGSTASLPPLATPPLPGQPAAQGGTPAGSSPAPVTDPSKTSPPQDPNSPIENPVPVVKPCVGARQIADPHSPRCETRGWVQGMDNGGETHRGVDANTIRIGISRHGGGGGAQPIEPEYQDLVKFFNSSFQFWGRKIELVAGPVNGGADYNTSPGKAALQAADAQVYYDLNVFASGTHGQAMGQGFYEEAAKKGIVTVDTREPGVDENYYNNPAWRGRQWSYYPGPDKIQASLGKWICNRLVANSKGGRGGDGNADFAGALVEGKPRKFGYLITTHPDHEVQTAVLDSELDACGSKPGQNEIVEARFQQAGPDTRTLVNDLKNAGVTSIICLCKNNDMRGSYMPFAESAAYYPEWIISSFGQADFDRYQFTGPASQMENSFGLSHRSKQVRESDLPVSWGISAINPSYQWSKVCCFSNAHAWQFWRYPQLLMLASGIQLAGPNLTPETFAAGLQSAGAFPNDDPDCGPLNCDAARASFDGDHTMMDDFAEIWWSNDRPSNWDVGSPGTFCLVGAGTRHSTAEALHGKPPLFEGPCHY